ncbi:unnamed protein product [Cladocopium goreaui]|uniref:DNA (Cytosine-5)-methyltransferase 3B n=1 Tax=Cladocopium goreaui TaxID=2562237 RepID=A0A9P1GAA5_9DINO|nr:unnamed protein product [Cladocopium goreaui]
MDGSLALECKHLGCTNNSYDAELDRAFNDAPYFIHLCLSEPCVAPDMDGVDTTQGLHATRVRLWDMSAFVRDQVYVTADCLALADRWLKEAGETRAPHKAKAKPGAPPGPGRRKPAAKGADAAPKPGRGRRAPAEKAQRLKETRERLQGKVKETTEVEEIPGSDVESRGSEAPSTIDSGYAEDEGLISGLNMETKSKKKEKTEAVLDRTTSGDPRRLLKSKDSKQLALKDITTSSLSGQLVRKALEVTSKRKEDKKQKRTKKGKSRTTKITETLVKLLTGKEIPSDKKRKKRKTRRLEDGTIVSSSPSCSDYSEEDASEKASPDAELEAPMQKKSRDNPGSVLRLLVDHIRQQMDQTALLECGNESRETLPAWEIRWRRDTWPSIKAWWMLPGRRLVTWTHPMEDSSAAGQATVLATRKHARLVSEAVGALPLSGASGIAGKGRASRGKGEWSYGDNRDEGKGNAKGRGKGKKGKTKWGGNQGASWEKTQRDWEKNKDKARAPLGLHRPALLGRSLQAPRGLRWAFTGELSLGEAFRLPRGLRWAFTGHLNSQKSTLFFTLFNSTAWPRASRKRVALPVRLGELRMVRGRLLESSFAGALQHAFVQEFPEAEKRVVLSIRGAVKNMLRHSVDMRADLSAIEKDVKLLLLNPELCLLPDKGQKLPKLPAMGFFESIWEFVGRKQFSLDLVRRVRRELFTCVAPASLMQANLASGVSGFTTASDASHFGGAVGLADSLTDEGSLDRELLSEILLKFPEVRELHLWAGFPCVDLSSAKAGREGLAGAQSSLFYEVVRIIKLLKQECEPTFTVKYATENVASMPKKDLEEISAELETVPFHLNSSDAVPMNRPRLCWTSESLWDAVTGIEIEEEHFWWKVTAKNVYPDQQHWLEAGVNHTGSDVRISTGEIMVPKAFPRQSVEAE